MADWKTLIRDIRRRRFAEKYRATHGDRFSAYGLDVEVPAHVSPNVRYVLAKGRPYEAEEAHYIKQHIPKGMHVLELGGSIGVISRLIRATIGPEAQHIAVEANPDLACVCEANAMRGSDPARTRMIEAAVAYTSEAHVSFSRGDTAHTGHLARAGEADTFEAAAITLSALVAQMPPEPWALVSDIEGGELDMFLREPPETFARVAHAVIEIHPKAFAAMGSSEAAFLDRLTACGFQLMERTADVVLLRGPAAGGA